MSDAALIATERALGAKSLVDYVEMAWPLVEPTTPFVHTWHIDVICEHLEAVSACQIRNLCINVPPGMSKSLLVSVFWPTWEWTERPPTKFISTSYDGTLALRDAYKAQFILESEWYRERWGDKFAFEPAQAVSDYKNSAGGWNYSAGIGGKITGRHCHIFKVDDPHKPLTISPVSLDTVRRFWRGTMPTRFSDLKTSRKVVIMQRLHERDLSALCEEDGFEMLRLPMRFERAACSYTKIGGDPRTEEGELLCPERVPEDALEDLEKALQDVGGSRNVAAQLQQRPVPEGGALFKREDFRYWSVKPIPGHETRLLDPSRTKPDQQLQSWDCAFKDQDGNDFVAGGLWWRIGPDFFLMWQIWDHMNFTATCQAVRDMSARFPKCIKKLVEDKANGTAVIDTLQKTLSGFEAVNPEGGKVARANAVSGLFEGHNVFFPHPLMVGPHGEDYSWVNATVDEFVSFPVGAHDDRVDQTTQALNFMYQRRSRLKEAMAKVRGRGGLVQEGV